ncbi:MAG: hypothetical protein GY719_40290 [bacterium]|nr:hypothetical protein [bacterium]
MPIRKRLITLSTLFSILLLVPSLLWAGDSQRGGGARSEIHLQVATNGYDADSATGPSIPVGETVIWEYWVTNTGGTTLSQIIVVDDRIGAVNCPGSNLEPGQYKICYALGTAIEGQYGNRGTVSGRDTAKHRVTDSDPSHYLGVDD